MFDASSHDTTMSETPNKNTCQKDSDPILQTGNVCDSVHLDWWHMWIPEFTPAKMVWNLKATLSNVQVSLDSHGVSHCRKLPFSLDNTTQAETHPQIWVIFLLSFYIRILAMNPLAIGSVYFRIVSLLMSFHCHFKAHFSREAHTWQSHKNCQD